MSSGSTHVSYAADPPSLAMQPYSDQENPFQAFFGEPTKMYKTTAYDAKKKSTWVLPDAYVGKSAMLGEIIEVLTLTDSNWYTQVAMPIERTDNTRIQWSIWEYDPMLAPIVPELGVVRLVKSNRRGRSETFLRRGVGFQVEHGFMNTAEGVRHYVTQLLQLQQSIVETNNFGVLNAYLTAQDFNRTWEKNYGIYNDKRVKHVLDRERHMWGILQQQKKGIEVLDAELTETMNRYRATADIWIFPPKIRMYLEIAPDSRTDYSVAGSIGPKRLVDGPEGLTTLQGSRVFLTRTFEVDMRGPVDFMKRPTKSAMRCLTKTSTIAMTITSPTAVTLEFMMKKTTSGTSSQLSGHWITHTCLMKMVKWLSQRRDVTTITFPRLIRRLACLLTTWVQTVQCARSSISVK